MGGSGNEAGSVGNGPAPAHVLLTVLGTNPKLARYTLGGRETEVQLVPDVERPDRVPAICTPEAKRESWPLLGQALDGRCKVEAVNLLGSETYTNISFPEKFDGIPHSCRHHLDRKSVLGVSWITEMGDRYSSVRMDRRNRNDTVVGHRNFFLF